MAVKLHQPGYNHARKLVADGRVVLDDRDDWSEHQPSAAEENAFIDEHGYAVMGGAADVVAEHLEAHYKFPYGDFEAIHRCAVLAAESRAGQRKYGDVESAAAHLHGMLEVLRQSSAR